MSGKNVMRAVAGTAVVLLATGAAGPGVAAVVTADSGDVQATVRKTVLQTGNAVGEIATSRMYTQVSAVGNGTKTVTVPVGVTSNRNLNEFGAFPMEGESIVFDLTVSDGAGIEERTLTDADINPMQVSVKVMLDGVEVAPEDLVGANGVLDVEYTVRNTTARTEPLTFTDVEGNEVTEDVEIADPFAGSLDVILPQGFNEITAPGATVAGNGQNETQLGYTFLLFPPLGSAEVKVGYQSRISNGQMPAAEFSFLPLVPYDNSTIAGTTEALKGGASTGAAIFDAGTQIGDNLLKLQEGAGKLVAGLGQLSAGASQLSDGLVNTAAPGSEALADGANQVADGLDQLNDNVPALEEGVSDLNAGAQKLNGGAEQVADGNAKLAAGANSLNQNVPALASGVDSLNSNIQKLAAGMASLQAGIDTLSKGVAALPTTIKDNPGYQQLQGALTGVQTAIDKKFIPGIDELIKKLSSGSAPSGTPSLADKDKLAKIAGQLQASGAKQGVSYLLSPDMLNCTDSSTPQAQALTAALGQPVKSCLKVMRADPATTVEPEFTYLVLAGLVNNIGDGTPPPPNTSPSALYGLNALKFGLSNPACDPKDAQNAANPCGIYQIQGLVAAGINQLIAGISAALITDPLSGKGIGTTPVDPTKCVPENALTCAAAQLNAGTKGLAAGSATLNSKVPALAGGVSQLASAADQLAAGSAQVADGTEQLADGTEQLNDRVPTLASGVEQLDDGAGQVADGADQLAAGLGAAADGSGQLADGLAQAEPGGAQIEDGAGQLKEQGADELAKTGKEAQLDYAKRVAMLEAAQQAGLEGVAIPFGPAEGTDVVTTAAYKMELAGITAEEENTALKYGMAILLLIAGGLAGVAGARRIAG